MKTRKLLGYSFLAALGTALIPTSDAFGHELDISVVGKGSSTHQIPDEIGNSFFLMLQGIRATTENEIELQIEGDFDDISVSYSEVYPDMSLTLEGENSSSFDADIRAFGFSVGGSYDCGLSCGVIFDISTDYMSGTGSVDFFNGSADLSAHAVGFDVGLCPTGVVGAIASWLGIDHLVEAHIESTVEDELRFEFLELSYLGLSEILAGLPNGLVNAVGINPHDLLQNPFEGLILDIDFLEPQTVWSDTGTIELVIHHRPVNAGGSTQNDAYGHEMPKLTWAPVPNAVNYRIFRKSYLSPQWQEWDSTTATEWTDDSVHAELNVRSSFASTQEWTAYYVVAENHLGIRSKKFTTWFFEILDEGGVYDGPGMAF